MMMKQYLKFPILNFLVKLQILYTDIVLSWRNHTEQVEHCLLHILIRYIIHVQFNIANDLLLSFSLL